MIQMVRHLVLFLYLLPLGVVIGYSGDKPITITYSIVCLLVIPLALAGGRHFNRQSFLVLLMLSYFPILAALGSLFHLGSTSSIFSGMSFSIVFIHILVGDWFFRTYGFSGFRKAAAILAGIIAVLLISDVLLGSFPRGCSYQGRWGGCFGNFTLYGYPNSSSTFLAILSPVFIFSFLTNRNLTWRFFHGAILLLLSFIILLSLSRSASVVLLVVFYFTFLQLRPLIALTLVPLSIGGILFFTRAYWSDALLTRGLLLRIEAAISNGDISGGRFDIWADTIKIVSKSPVFGTAFQPFSQYSEYGTVHQQYLEVLFKSGILGFAIYFGLLAYLYVGFKRSEFYLKSQHPKELAICVNSFTAAILLGALFQPILTYQPLGALVFFLFGAVIAAKTTKGLT